jgi:sugar lactone lactonase YvrE
MTGRCRNEFARRLQRVPGERGTGVSRTLVAILISASCIPAACGGDGEKRADEPKPARPPDVALGEMVTVAGGGAERGDGGPATSAGFCSATDVAVDRAGSLYIADGGLYCEGPAGNSVRKVDTKGIVSTIVGGSGTFGFAGDGGPAAEATLDVPLGVAADAQGNLYISDADSFRIRKIDSGGTISTLAGTGEPGHSGDGGPAISARLTAPAGLAVDERGNLYVADFAAVRKIDRSGRITTVAGTGSWVRKPDPEHIKSGPRTRFTGEGGNATRARLVADDVAVDPRGNLFIADGSGDRVYRVDRDGTIVTVAGTVSGRGRRLGDGGPATSAFIDLPAAVDVDRRGNVLIADHHGERIRKVDPRGTITTIAGTGEKGASAARGAATELDLNDPNGLAVGPPGIVYVADLFNARVVAVRYEQR